MFKHDSVIELAAQQQTAVRSPPGRVFAVGHSQAVVLCCGEANTRTSRRALAWPQPPGARLCSGVTAESELLGTPWRGK